jgi:GDP-L-fucose synthase
MNFTYAILTNLFGPNDRFDEVNGHVIPSLVSKFHRAAREGGAVTVWGSGRARRDFLLSKDAAAALRLAGQLHSGPINVATGVTVPIKEIVECLSRVSGVTDVTWDTTKPDGQLDRSYDVSRLANLGFRNRFSLEEGLRTTYAWYSENFPNVRK